MVTRSGRGIDQEIVFTVSSEDMEKITGWIQRIDAEGLTQGPHRTEETEAYVSLQISAVCFRRLCLQMRGKRWRDGKRSIMGSLKRNEENSGKNGKNC